MGNITFLINGEERKCNFAQSIPSEPLKIREIRATKRIQYVLIVEKETVFSKIAASTLLDQYPGVLITVNIIY